MLFFKLCFSLLAVATTVHLPNAAAIDTTNQASIAGLNSRGAEVMASDVAHKLTTLGQIDPQITLNDTLQYINEKNDEFRYDDGNLKDLDNEIVAYSEMFNHGKLNNQHLNDKLDWKSKLNATTGNSGKGDDSKAKPFRVHGTLRKLLDENRFNDKTLIKDLVQLTNGSDVSVEKMTNSVSISTLEVDNLEKAWGQFYELFSPLKHKLLKVINEPPSSKTSNTNDPHFTEPEFGSYKAVNDIPSKVPTISLAHHIKDNNFTTPIHSEIQSNLKFEIVDFDRPFLNATIPEMTIKIYPSSSTSIVNLTHVRVADGQPSSSTTFDFSSDISEAVKALAVDLTPSNITWGFISILCFILALV